MKRFHTLITGAVLILALAVPARLAKPATCTLGELSAPNTSDNTMDLRGLTVYQLVDPTLCTGCPGGSVVLNTVLWQFRYYSTLCPLTFEVSVVATDHAPCPKPDTMSALCQPFTYVYQATGGPPHIVTIPIPGGCCITGQAFVKVKLVDTGGCPTGQLAFFEAAPCRGTCRSYSTFPDYPLDDSCNLFDANPTITVSADCCPITPVGRRSWGSIKLHYR
jgi:hypothetical protein